MDLHMGSNKGFIIPPVINHGSHDEHATSAARADQPHEGRSRKSGGFAEAERMESRLYMTFSLATNAFAQPLTNYLIKRYNMKQNTATDVANIFSGTSSFSPVVGAFAADALWGRFRTLVFGIVAAFLGMVIVTLSATISHLKPPSCGDVARQAAGECAGPSGIHLAVLYIGMALHVVAAAGFNPTSIPFGADQFDAANDNEGEEAAGLKRYYNWCYAVAMAASFVAFTFVPYVQDKVSWGLSFGIPTALMLVAFAVFLAGTPLYVHVPPEGSIFSSVARVLVASCRKWSLKLPHPRDARQQEAHLYNPPFVAGGNGRVFKLPLTLQLTFFNKAAIIMTDADEIRPDGTPARPWSLCSVQQVEEVKCLVKIIPVWISGLLSFIVSTELTNYTFLQALTMDLHIGSSSKGFTIPPVSIIAVYNLTILLFVPVYDLLIARAAQRVTKVEGGITVLQRQGVGVAISAVALVVAAVFERRRRGSALENGGITSPMSVFLLSPQLAVMGIAVAFNMIGQLEFYNTQFPDQMRTLANAAFYCAQGASNYMATLVVNIVNARTRRHGGGQGWVPNDINAGKLDYFYYAMAVFAVVNLIYFLVCSYFYRYKGWKGSIHGSYGERVSAAVGAGQPHRLYMATAMAFNAFAQPVTNYLIKRYNMKPNTATKVTNIFSGTYSFSPVVGAFVADAFCGRFWTLLFGAVAALVAMVVITLSATISQLKPPSCSDVARQAGTCAGPSSLHRAVLYIGMALLVVATGGYQPTSLPFGADQFDLNTSRRDTSDGNETNGRCHEDNEPAGLKRYYNWYYVINTAAAFVALTFIVYIQDKVSWGLGFAIPTALLLAGLAVFLAGAPLYVYVHPQGSIFSSVARVLVASCRNSSLRLPHPRDARQQVAHLYNPPVVVGGGNGRVFKLPLTLQLSFLNKAAIVTDAENEIKPDGSPARPWRLCSVQQVEETKCLVKIIPVWISGVMWFITLAELTNYTFLQALTMDLHMGKRFIVPPVSIVAIFYLSIVLFVPVYDLLITRAAQRVTKVEGGVTVLQRQGVGVAISAVSLVVAAVTERRRRASVSPPSVFLLAPQLAVMGVSAAFNMIGQMEFYNTQFPDQMRTLANAAFYCAQGASSYLATLVVNIVNARTRRHGGGQGWVVNDINAGRLDNFYYTMAVFAGINFVYFLVCSYFYRYKDEPQEEADSSPVTREAVLVKIG
uniref:Uncharacterized protein n=1 Tax=Leersia perrieri TaxID=77586 RepID=A0A0D9WAP4_9ORYZ